MKQVLVSIMFVVVLDEVLVDVEAVRLLRYARRAVPLHAVDVVAGRVQP